MPAGGGLGARRHAASMISPPAPRALSMRRAMSGPQDLAQVAGVVVQGLGERARADVTLVHPEPDDLGKVRHSRVPIAPGAWTCGPLWTCGPVPWEATGHYSHITPGARLTAGIRDLAHATGGIRHGEGGREGRCRGAASGSGRDARAAGGRR